MQEYADRDNNQRYKIDINIFLYKFIVVSELIF